MRTHQREWLAAEAIVSEPDPHRQRIWFRDYWSYCWKRRQIAAEEHPSSRKVSSWNCHWKRCQVAADERRTGIWVSLPFCNLKIICVQQKVMSLLNPSFNALYVQYEASPLYKTMQTGWVGWMSSYFLHMGHPRVLNDTVKAWMCHSKFHLYTYFVSCTLFSL